MSRVPKWTFDIWRLPMHYECASTDSACMWMCAYLCLFLYNMCEHVALWVRLAVSSIYLNSPCSEALQLTASRKRGREVSPGIKGQGRLWIICYGWGATFIAISSPYREWLFDSTPQQYSQTQPSPLILPAATSPWLLSLNICDNQPYFSIPPCHLQRM